MIHPARRRGTRLRHERRDGARRPRPRRVAPRPKPRRSPRDTTPRAPSRRAPRDRTPPPAWTTRLWPSGACSAFASASAQRTAAAQIPPPVASRSTAPYAAVVWAGEETAPSSVCTRASEAVHVRRSAPACPWCGYRRRPAIRPACNRGTRAGVPRLASASSGPEMIPSPNVIRSNRHLHRNLHRGRSVIGVKHAISPHVYVAGE